MHRLFVVFRLHVVVQDAQCPHNCASSNCDDCECVLRVAAVPVGFLLARVDMQTGIFKHGAPNSLPPPGPSVEVIMWATAPGFGKWALLGVSHSFSTSELFGALNS